MFFFVECFRRCCFLLSARVTSTSLLNFCFFYRFLACDIRMPNENRRADVYRWMDGWMDGWMDRWIDGRMPDQPSIVGRAPIQLLPLPPLLRDRCYSDDGRESVGDSDTASEIDASVPRSSSVPSSKSIAKRASGGGAGSGSSVNGSRGVGSRGVGSRGGSGGGCPARPRVTASGDGDGGGGGAGRDNGSVGGGDGSGEGEKGGVGGDTADKPPSGHEHDSPSATPRSGTGTRAGNDANQVSAPESAGSAEDKENRVQGRRAPAWEHRGSLGGGGGGKKTAGVEDAAFDADGRGGGDAGAGGGGLGRSITIKTMTRSPAVENGGGSGGGRTRPLESRTIRSVTRSPALGTLDNGRHPSRGR